MSVSAMWTDDWLTDARTSYDTVTVGHADSVRDAMTRLSYLRAALVLFADSVRAAGGGPVADIGRGPGHVTAHLHAPGVDAFGIDLSPGMVTVARRDHPGLRFEVGSMTNPDLPAASVTGLPAWQSLIHVPDDDFWSAGRASPHGRSLTRRRTGSSNLARRKPASNAPGTNLLGRTGRPPEPLQGASAPASSTRPVGA